MLGWVFDFALDRLLDFFDLLAKWRSEPPPSVRPRIRFEDL